MNNLSYDRLKALASGDAWACIQDDEGQIMARELLALRRAQREPIAFIAECGAIIGEGSPFFDDYKNPQPLYAAPQLPAVPDGWVMVPIEPTAEMIREGMECASAAVYRRMIAAAPKPGSDNG